MEAINWHSLFFYLFAALACGAAVAVVLCANIVRMAFALVVALGAVAGLFFLAGADFLGALQLLVYVGGTVVLLVFGVMLTSQRPLFTLRVGAGQWIAAVATSACLLAVLLRAALAAHAWAGPPLPEQLPEHLQPTTTRIGLALLGVRADKLDQPDPILRQGMSGYLLPFEIASVHLLVVLIGAVFLARTKRRIAESGPSSHISLAGPHPSGAAPPSAALPDSGSAQIIAQPDNSARTLAQPSQQPRANQPHDPRHPKHTLPGN